jgi:hypothetical protein
MIWPGQRHIEVVVGDLFRIRARLSAMVVRWHAGPVLKVSFSRVMVCSTDAILDGDVT